MSDLPDADFEYGRIGPLAADLIEQIEREHPNAQVGEVGIVVELLEEGDAQTTIVARATSARRWVAAGLFAAGLRAIERIRD